MNEFYALYPILFENNIIFSANNSLYKYDRIKKTTEQLLSNSMIIKHIIKYKNKIIFVSNFETGPDIYLMDLTSTEIKRITYYENTSIKPLSFNEESIIYSNNENSNLEILKTYEYNLKTNITKELEFEDIHSYIKINGSTIIFQKHEYGYLNWNNYKGGLKGKLYKNDKPLIELENQAINPIYFENRIYFIYDHQNGNNIYSCNLEGKDLTQHTFYYKFKILSLSNQNEELIYSILGEIYIFNFKKNEINKINIDYKIQKPIKYQSLSEDFLTQIDIVEDKVVCSIKGNVFEKNLYSGGFLQLSNDLRFIECGYINKIPYAFKDGRISELYIYEDKNNPKIFKLDSQKIISIKSSNELIAYSNHKNELKIIDLNGKEELIETAKYVINYFDFSQDNKFLAYSIQTNTEANIFLYNIEIKEKIQITNDGFNNINPKFSQDNKFLIFTSNKDSKVIHDKLKFDHYFEIKDNIYYIPLIQNFDLKSPWIYEKNKEITDIKWDLTNLNNKIIKLPMKGKFKQIYSIEDKILAVKKHDKINVLMSLNLQTLTEETIIEDFNWIKLSNDKKHMIISTKNGIKITKAGEKLEDSGYKNKSLNFNNINCKTLYQKEIENIFDELTWLMEEFFWNKEHSKTLNEKIKEYKPYLQKIKTNHELYHLLNQIQGEMKTSHSYIFSPKEQSSQGKLCCDIKYHEEKQLFYIEKILNKTNKSHHAIYDNNLNIEQCDFITKINNQKITLLNPIEKVLHNQAKQHATIEILDKNNTLKTFELKLSNKKIEQYFRYKNLINETKNYVLTKNENIGYIHIPDMQQFGFKEFFEQYLCQYNKKCLIIDVRNNNGGNVSSLLIEQLAKKKLGLDLSRHNGQSELPINSSEGNFVLLINAHTASDGELFAEQFKQLKLGPIFGERTWGGVVGICPKYELIDNLLTSQPEFATHFFGTKKEIENHGVEPDIEIEDTWKNKNQNTDLILNEAIKYCKNNYL